MPLVFRRVFRDSWAVAALMMSAACSDRAANDVASASASAAEAPAAPPPIEAQLFPEGPSLLGESKLLELVPREAHGAVVVAGWSALEPVLPEAAKTPATRDALVALLAVELKDYVRRPDSSSGDYEAKPPDLAPVVAALDLEKPFGVAILDDAAEAYAFSAAVRDEAALIKALQRIGGAAKPKEASGAKVLALGAAANAVLRGEVVVFVSGGRWFRRDTPSSLAKWTERIATGDPSGSIGGQPWMRAATERVRFGKHALVVLQPSVATAGAIAFDREQLARQKEEKKTDKKRDDFWNELISDLNAATASLEGRSPALVVGVEITRDEVRAKGWLPAVDAKPPLDPPRQLPPAFAELDDRSVRLRANLGKEAAAAVGADHRFRIRRGYCAFRPKVVSQWLSGDVVVLDKAAAWGVTDDKAAWDSVKAFLEKEYAEPAGNRWKVDDATRTVSCVKEGIRVAEKWVVISEEPALLKRFPAAGGARPVDAKPRVREIAGIEGTIARARPVLVEPNVLGMFGGAGVLGSRCSFGIVGMFSRPTEEQTKAYNELCKELGQLEEKQSKARGDAMTKSSALLGSLELVAKPADGGAFVYGTWLMDAPSTHDLVSRLLEAWQPAAPTAEGGKRITQIQKKLTALEEQIRKEGFDALPPIHLGPSAPSNGPFR